jgi:hypothetical protein
MAVESAITNDDDEVMILFEIIFNEAIEKRHRKEDVQSYYRLEAKLSYKETAKLRAKFSGTRLSKAFRDLAL